MILCDKCAKVHRNFGDQYSKIRSLLHDDWDYTSVLYIRLGSNMMFQSFLLKYSLENAQPEVRYKTYAAEYYRKRVFFFNTLVGCYC